MITASPMSTRGEELPRMREDLTRALKKPVEQRRWTMVMNTKRCTACYACVVACLAENGSPPGVAYRRVSDVESGEYPQVTRTFMPINCMQCDNPPCMKAAPAGAITKRPDGIVAFDYDKLKGKEVFARVSKACPYNAVSFDEGTFFSDGTPARQPYEEQVSPEYNEGLRRADGGSPIGNARKCHFCLHRLEAGMLPACVTSCIGHATYFGDANDPDSLVAELVGRPEARRLKEELGTRPRVYYLT